jgi:DNA-binding PadR family transcriptional regulator
MGKESLGEFELLVLLACIRLGGSAAYAVSIVDEIRERTGRDIHRAAVYVTLQRLEKKRLISTKLGAPIAERGGKARREVHVEPAGLEAVRESRAALQRMWGGLGSARVSRQADVSFKAPR